MNDNIKIALTLLGVLAYFVFGAYIFGTESIDAFFVGTISGAGFLTYYYEIRKGLR